MSILQAIILGLVQGATEYAPVSSSGHLILVPWLFDWPILANPELNKTFDVALHMGTLLGALIYFRRDIASYLRAWVRSIRARRVRTTEERLAWAIVVGTIPGVIIGGLFADTIEEDLGQPWLIAVMLAVFGVVLYVVDRALAGPARVGLDRPADGPRPRHRAGARAAARRVALGDHDDRGSNDRAGPRERGAVLVPAVAPDHRGGRPLQGDRSGADRVSRATTPSSSGASSRRRSAGSS